MPPISAPQYPVSTGPTFSSIAQRQRMELDDALAAQTAAEQRRAGVAMKGGKAFVGYDKMLRGFMEAKYARPELKFWDYATNPSAGAAYRLQGRKKIGVDLEAGMDIKDIPGMGFVSRQKAGLKGLLGRDALPELKSDAKIIDSMEKAGEKRLASRGASEIDATEPSISPLEEQIRRAKEYKLSASGGADPADIQKAQILQQKNIDSLNLTGAGDDAMAAVQPGAEEVAKGGLKSTLGKVAGGVGAGLSVAAGVEKLKSKDQATRIGGAMQVAGGAAGAVALTNFWNPVGWAAAIPAALSIGGGLMGGGGADPLAKTPLGRYRRRVGIG